MEPGRTYNDMTEKEREIYNKLGEALSPLAKEAYYNGVDIGMFCSLAFSSANIEYMYEHIKYKKNKMLNKN